MINLDTLFERKYGSIRGSQTKLAKELGVDLYRVSKLLGHSSIRMTEIYAHLAPTDLKQAITKLPKIK